MAISFPTSLDNFTNPSSGNTLDSPSHSLQHSDINDAVEAMQRKVGVGTAVAGSATAGQVLTISAAGTSTWSTPTAPGLIEVVPASVAVGSGSGSVDANGAVTFTGASSISLNSCFTSAYENYRIVANITSSVNTAVLQSRLRTSGTDNTTSNYFNLVRGLDSNAAANNILSKAQTSWSLFWIYNVDSNPFVIDVTNPQATKRTAFLGSAVAINSAGNEYVGYELGSLFTATTSFESITFFASTGTITGTIRVYGYNN